MLTKPQIKAWTPLPQISLDLSTSFAESLTPLGLEEPLRKLNNFLNNKNRIWASCDVKDTTMTS